MSQNDPIARSKRILALVDAYEHKPSKETRDSLRHALFEEFAAAEQGRPTPSAQYPSDDEIVDAFNKHSFLHSRACAVADGLREVSRMAFDLGAAQQREVDVLHKCRITLSGSALRDAVEMLGGCDDDEVGDITIIDMDEWKDAETGKVQPAGLYGQWAEVPEEGFYGPLGASSAIKEATPDMVMVPRAALEFAVRAASQVVAESESFVTRNLNAGETMDCPAWIIQEREHVKALRDALRSQADHSVEAVPVERRIECRADKEGDCSWSECPQLRDGEPAASGRHCPLDVCNVCGTGNCPGDETCYPRDAGRAG